jgi:hypothetical protein
LRAHVAQLVGDVGIGGVQLVGDLQLDERLVEPAAGTEAPASGEVLERRPQLRAVETEPRLVVRRILAQYLRVFDDRLVVILERLRPLAGPHAGGCRAPGHRCGEKRGEGGELNWLGHR